LNNLKAVRAGTQPPHSSTHLDKPVGLMVVEVAGGEDDDMDVANVQRITTTYRPQFRLKSPKSREKSIQGRMSIGFANFESRRQL
jgi:hypothetical protein